MKGSPLREVRRGVLHAHQQGGVAGDLDPIPVVQGAALEVIGAIHRGHSFNGVQPKNLAVPVDDGVTAPQSGILKGEVAGIIGSNHQAGMDACFHHASFSNFQEFAGLV